MTSHDIIPIAEDFGQYDGETFLLMESSGIPDMLHAPQSTYVIDCIPDPELCLPYAAPLLSLATSSTYSDSPYDVPFHDKAKRQFGIVARAGLGSPESLDIKHMDSVHVRPPEEDSIVWDSLEPFTLFEIIRECFDPEGAGKRFYVVNLVKNETVKDPMPDAMIAERPKRPKNLPDNMTIPWRMHLAEWMDKWSGKVGDRAQATIDEMTLIYGFDTESGENLSPYWKYYASNIVKARRLMERSTKYVKGRVREDLAGDRLITRKGLRFERRFSDMLSGEQGKYMSAVNAGLRR